MTPTRTSRALTEVRTVLTRAVTAHKNVQTGTEVDHVDAYVDEDGTYVPGGSVTYRDEQADEIEADLQQVIEILTKYAVGGKPRPSMQERRLAQIRRNQG
jgi:hypothetical protein